MGVRDHWLDVLQSLILKESLHYVLMSFIQGKLQSCLSILYVMRIVNVVTYSQLINHIVPRKRTWPLGIHGAFNSHQPALVAIIIITFHTCTD